MPQKHNPLYFEIEGVSNRSLELSEGGGFNQLSKMNQFKPFVFILSDQNYIHLDEYRRFEMIHL